MIIYCILINKIRKNFVCFTLLFLQNLKAVILILCNSIYIYIYIYIYGCKFIYRIRPTQTCVLCRLFIKPASIEAMFFMSIEFLWSKSLFRQSNFHFKLRACDMCKIMMVAFSGSGRPWSGGPESKKKTLQNI